MAEFASVMIIIILLTLSIFGIVAAVCMLQEDKIMDAFLVVGVTTVFSIMMIGIVGFNYERYTCSCTNEVIEGGSEK